MAAAGNRCGLVVCNGRGFRHRSADHATGRHAARGAAWRTAAYGRPNRRYAVYPRAVATHYGAYRLLPILSAPARRACFIGLRPFHVPYPRTCRSSHGICPFPNNTGYHPRQLPEGGRISGKPWKVGLRIGKDTTLHRHLLPDRGRRTNYLSGIPQPDRHDGQQLRQTDAQPGHERQKLPHPRCTDCPDNLRIPFSRISGRPGPVRSRGTDHAARPKRSRPQPRRHTGGRGTPGDRPETAQRLCGDRCCTYPFGIGPAHGFRTGDRQPAARMDRAVSPRTPDQKRTGHPRHVELRGSSGTLRPGRPRCADDVVRPTGPGHFAARQRFTTSCSAPPR